MRARSHTMPPWSRHMGSFMVGVEVLSGRQVKPFLLLLIAFISQLTTPASLATARGAADKAFLMITSSLAAASVNVPLPAKTNSTGNTTNCLLMKRLLACRKPSQQMHSITIGSVDLCFG